MATPCKEEKNAHVQTQWLTLLRASPFRNMWNLPYQSGAMPHFLGEEISCQASDGYSRHTLGVTLHTDLSLIQFIINSDAGTTKMYFNCQPSPTPLSVLHVQRLAQCLDPAGAQ